MRAGLPTYAFQRERYWLSAAGGTGDLSGAGLSQADHPLLGAAVGLAGGGEQVFTGRLGLDTHPWLADHAVLGRVLLPGTAFVELALHAAREMGCDAVSELVLEAPLILAGEGSVQLQVRAGEPDENGRHPVSIRLAPSRRLSRARCFGRAFLDPPCNRHAGHEHLGRARGCGLIDGER